jgi:hypothetical protein
LAAGMRIESLANARAVEMDFGISFED